MSKRKAADQINKNSTMGLIHYHAVQSTSSITESVLAELDTPYERIILDLKVSLPALISASLRYPTCRTASIRQLFKESVITLLHGIRHSSRTTPNMLASIVLCYAVLCCALDRLQKSRGSPSACRSLGDSTQVNLRDCRHAP